jgi:hypothetical protein
MTSKRDRKNYDDELFKDEADKEKILSMNEFDRELIIAERRQK